MPYTSKMIPPQNIEAEQAVLGAVLLQDKALLKIVELLTPNDFYRDAHKTIFAAMLALFEKREPHDLITVTGLLSDQRKLEEIGGASYLASLTDIVPLSGSLVHHAHIIRRKSILRRLIQTTSEVAARCYDAQDDIETLVDEAEKTIFEIAHSNKGQGFQSMSTVVPRAFERITRLFDQEGNITGIATGYEEIDRMTAGLQPAELIVLAARPSMGKTALAMNIVQHVAVINKVAVAVFSLEMSNEALVLRMLCSLGHIDSQRIRTGKLHTNDWPKLTRATGMLSDAPIFIDDTAGLTVLEMRAKARRLKAEHNLGLVVVDYLQLMQGKNSAENRAQEIADISRSLKAMAKELDVPVLALSQLNRSLENRTDKRPQLADLRESGAIEQDADVIMFIYRDEVYNRADDNPNRGIAEIIVGKQRNGPTGVVKLTFLGEYTSFENYSNRFPGAPYQPEHTLTDADLN
ncbi:replicative DNA helicase [Desulfobulbus oligotrophicus]|uniref:Replicative DNA helicase n=2 Tax=Desulfobulbus oligotrophicus TaxID=1909699 RepID=A0A7T5VFN1_9BACT|nr:replicative DNA helicase [Desulfobulbus oligotrophicus]QQG67032.1 replicative DNA helicase [Desulfobulbus oligotrophicus]